MNAPPILVSFYSDIKKYLLALSDDGYPQDHDHLKALFDRSLPPIESASNVALLFGYSPRFLGYMMKKPSDFYREFELRNGNKRRVIQAPKVALKVIQKWMGHHIARSITLPDYVCGFVPNRSTVHGSIRHCGAKWVYSTDIKNFFQTTSLEKIKSAFINLGYTEYGAGIAAALCCLNGNLAQGAPSSPVLSNLIFQNADKLIYGFCVENDLKYSRYADDIAISGKGNVNSDVSEFVKSVITAEGYSVASDKTTMKQSPERLKVYGLLVHESRPRLTKGYRNRIRALKHLKANGRLDPEREFEANGHLAYESSIQKHIAQLTGLDQNE